jgi:hypothetical protein
VPTLRRLLCVLPGTGSDSRWCPGAPGSNSKTGSQHQANPTSQRSRRAPNSIPVAPIFHPRWCPSGHDNSKGKCTWPREQKRALIEPAHPTLSVTEQCALLGLPRSSWYYQPVPPSATTQELLNRLDEQYTRTPFYGSRRMTAWLRSQGYAVNRKRVRRLLQLLGLEAIYPKPRTSTPAPGHRIYPYLLRGLPITQVDQVWSSDITYLRLAQGWL